MADQTTISDHMTTSFAVEIVSGPTHSGRAEDFELDHARRVLARLKALIGHQGLLDLLAAEIEKGDAFLREQVELSNGEFKSATTALSARGLKATQFLNWMDKSFSNEPVLLAAEPDHYVFGPNPDATVTVVENLGPYVCRVQLPAYDAAPNWSAAAAADLLPESEYPFRRIADMRLTDGTIVGRVMTQFGDTDQGFRAHLTAYFPASCPEELFEHHRQHLAVEFTNWITAAAAEQP